MFDSNTHGCCLERGAQAGKRLTASADWANWARGKWGNGGPCGAGQPSIEPKDEPRNDGFNPVPYVWAFSQDFEWIYQRCPSLGYHLLTCVHFRMLKI